MCKPRLQLQAGTEIEILNKTPVSLRRYSSSNMGEGFTIQQLLILGDCVGERLTLEVAPRYGSCKLVKMPCLRCKAPL